MTKERRLGRGLEALLGQPLPSEEGGWRNTETASADASALRKLNVYAIDSNPYQPRRDFDEADVQSLSESIKQHGLLQPIVVRQIDNRYQLIAGERRLRAAIKAGWSEVPAQVLAADDRQMAELAIVENLQRKDLNALEKAASFQQYIARYGCTQEELAGRLKIDRSTVANLIRLLELPQQVQDALRRGAITQGHARALLPLGHEPDQIAFSQRIQEEGLSVRATEQIVQQLIHDQDAEPLLVVTDDGRTTRTARTRGDHLASLEQEFRSVLGAKVDIRETQKGRGRITIHFKSYEEFERLQELLYTLAQPAARSKAG